MQTVFSGPLARLIGGGLLGLLAACAHANDLEIHGSNTIGAELAPALVAGYLKERNAASIRIQETRRENEKRVTASLSGKPFEARIEAHGSSTGFTGLNGGSAQIAAASRPAKDKEVALLASRADLRSPQSEHVVAIDGLAILVHPDNALSQLDKTTLAQIFAGQISNWQVLGGPDRPIHVYARDDRSGTWDTFRHLVLGSDYSLTDSARRYESNDQLSDDVSQDPAGIGFAGLASVRDSKVLAIADGGSAALLPSRLNVATEDYPLSRRLFMYSLGADDTPVTADFLDFVQSRKGQEIVQQTGYISQNIQAVEDDRGDSVPATLNSLTRDYQRLSVNFRFAEGRTKLDNKAQRDLDRLKRFLQSHHADGRDLMLIGYADKQSNELRAQMISELRALSVKKALRKEQDINVEAYTGYGHYAPVGSSGGEAGANRNGRVEVWFRQR
ncbi:substrate-binding domain-containing protein [Marinobacter sp. JSM 1782161]|uniref:substrate-binding domain-containing protein n=1 Tax=Marinobacter sp. JSM 1782161 TaxID=2685906 RepID=UPI001A9FF1FE|nr:substrate-binding domain-containing protein [Marinobacter sp. JSM 1782161]